MQTIYLDISNKGVIPCILAKQSEVGRKFLAVITDNGVPYNIPQNSLLSVWYEGDTDAGNYSSIDEKSAFSIDGNKVIVELVAQMLFNPGSGELCLSITHGNGGETNTWNIPYCVEYKPGAGSSVATEYYTALTEAGAIAAKYASEAKESAQFVSSLFIESEQYDGCYYRVVAGETEWVNPPMAIGVEYRTTERYNGNPVYAKCVDCEELPVSGQKLVDYTGVSTASVVRLYGRAEKGDTAISLPYSTASISAYGKQISINTTNLSDGWHGYVCVCYTK